MGLETRTPAELIDLLITTNIRCFMAQEDIANTSLSQEERFEASQRAHQMNNRRNQLIRALDNVLGFGEFTQLEKSYNRAITKNGP